MLATQTPPVDALARGAVSLRQAKGPIVAIFAGDSITFGNSDNNAGSTGANAYCSQLAWRSRGRIVQRRQIGIPGNTSTGVVVRLIDEALALPGVDVLFLLQGTNDVIQSIAPVITIRNDRLAIRAAHARGVRAILIALPPYAANPAMAVSLNTAKRLLAIDEGALWLDPWKALRASDGGWSNPAHSTDGIHPSQPAAALAADAILSDPVMAPLLGSFGAASLLPAGDLSSAIPNADFASSYAHARGTVAANWDVYATGATGGWSASLAIDPGTGLPLQTLTGAADFRGAFTLVSGNFDIGAHAGRRIAFSGRLKTSGLAASGGTLLVKLAGSGDAALGTALQIQPMFGLAVDGDGIFYAEGEVPAGASSAAITVTLGGVSAGTGVSFAVAEMTIRPVRTRGLDTRAERRPAGVRHVAANAVLTLDDTHVLVDASAGPVTVTLPGAGITLYGFGSYSSFYQRRVPGSGLDYQVIKTDGSANAVTIAVPAATTIEGATTLTLSAQWARARLLAAKPGLFVRIG